MFLNYFDMLILKMNLKKKNIYIYIYSTEKHFKKQHLSHSRL